MSKKAIQAIKTELVECSMMLAYMEWNARNENFLRVGYTIAETKNRVEFYHGKVSGLRHALTALKVSDDEMFTWIIEAEDTETNRCNTLRHDILTIKG